MMTKEQQRHLRDRVAEIKDWQLPKTPVSNEEKRLQNRIEPLQIHLNELEHARDKQDELKRKNFREDRYNLIESILSKSWDDALNLLHAFEKKWAGD